SPSGVGLIHAGPRAEFHEAKMRDSLCGQWWRSLCLILPAGLDQFYSEVDLHEFLQITGRTPGIRAAARADDVAGDLNRREHESPGKAPPAEEQTEARATDLAFRRARSAGQPQVGAPMGQHQGRPDTVDFVNVNRSASFAATGTITLVNGAHLLFQDVRRHVFGHAQD